MYENVIKDIDIFRKDIQNSCYNIIEIENIRSIFFSILHNVRYSIQNLITSCKKNNIKNKYNKYINDNLSPKDILLMIY